MCFCFFICKNYNMGKVALSVLFIGFCIFYNIYLNIGVAMLDINILSKLYIHCFIFNL